MLKQEEPVQLFISYAPEDDASLHALEKHLGLLRREGLIEPWDVRKVSAGEDWEEVVRAQLEAADIIVLLVSADFIASHFCFDVQMRRAMARGEVGEALVIPVLLRSCDWERAPFGKLRALPEGGKPVDKWARADDAFADIAKSLRRLVERRLEARRTGPARGPQSLVERDAELLPPRRAAPPVVANGPFVGVPSDSLGRGFKGREDALRKLHDALVGRAGVDVTDPPPGMDRVYVHGGGGVGKSRLAIEYTWRYRSVFLGGIFYSSAGTRGPLAIWAEIGRELFPTGETAADEDLALRFSNLLAAPGRGPTLIVFDDVHGNPQEVAERFTRRVRVQGRTIWPIDRLAPVAMLMTTRLSEIPDATPFELTQLSDQTAYELLIERSERAKLSAEEEQAARDLAGPVLGGHPLALALAGAYLKRVGAPFSFLEYRQKLEAKGLTVALEEVARHAGRSITDHDRSIVATYELSRKQLNLDDSEDALAWRILKIAGCLKPNVPIDRRLIRRMLEQDGSDVGMEEVGLAATRLVDLSLLDPSRDEENAAGDVMIHPLLADYTSWVAGADEHRRVQAGVIVALLGLFPQREEDSWSVAAPPVHAAQEWLSPAREAHAQHVWTRTEHLVTAPRAGLALALGAHHARRGDRKVGISLFTVAHALHERLAEQDPANVAWKHGLAVSRERIGDMLLDLGDPSGACAEFRAALDIVKRLAEQHPDDASWRRCVSIVHGKIGGALRAQGDTTGALAELRMAFDLAESLARQHPNHPEWQHDLCIAHIKLGDGLHVAGNSAGALDAYRAARALAEPLARSRPHDVSARRALAVIYLKMGPMERTPGAPALAIASYQTALAIAESLAESDPGNATWQTDLAAARASVASVLQQGSLMERTAARSLLEDARDILHDLGAASRLSHVQQQAWLPSIKRALLSSDLAAGHDGAALAFSPEADAGNWIGDPPDAEWRLSARRLQAQEDARRGGPTSRDAEDGLRESLRKDPNNLEIRMQYAQALMHHGRPEEALGVLEEGLVRRPDGDGPLSLIVATAIQTRGLLLLGLGRYEEASTSSSGSSGRWPRPMSRGGRRR